MDFGLRVLFCRKSKKIFIKELVIPSFGLTVLALCCSLVMGTQPAKQNREAPLHNIRWVYLLLSACLGAG